MTKNCKFETPCGMCELFERPCKDICIKNKNENFSPMKLIDIFELSTVNIKTGKLERNQSIIDNL